MSARPGFPIDRLMAGKGFAIALEGKSKPDFSNQKYANVTSGSVRIVFTPSTRSAASTAPQTAAAACPKT